MHILRVCKNMEQSSPPQIDRRMEYLSVFVQKTLKLKPEKWTRMMSVEDHKAVVMKFLERSYPVLLVIVLTPTAQLVAFSGFPLSQLKTKGLKIYEIPTSIYYMCPCLFYIGVYFIKKALIPVSKATPSETIIAGDLSSKIIDQLASLVDEVSINHL